MISKKTYIFLKETNMMSEKRPTWCPKRDLHDVLKRDLHDV